MFGRKQHEDTVRGRAAVPPAGTTDNANHEQTGGGISANWKASAWIPVKALSADDGLPVETGLVTIKTTMPDWTIAVLHQAGTNTPFAAKLPDHFEIDVLIGVTSRTVVDIDIDRLLQDLEPYRAVGVEQWKDTKGQLADIRFVMKIPGMAVKALKGLPGAARELVDDVKGVTGPDSPTVPKPSYSPQEVEQIRRSARILAHHFEKFPKEMAPTRASALQLLSMQAQNCAGGSIHVDDFETELMRLHVSTVITDDEAAEFRRQAGLESL